MKFLIRQSIFDAFIERFRVEEIDVNKIVKEINVLINTREMKDMVPKAGLPRMLIKSIN